MTASLLNLPHEVLHNILANTDPQDLASLCCCRDLYAVINNDRLLHKQLYLKHFDNPQLDSDSPEPIWSDQLKELVKLQKTLESHNAALKYSQLEAIAKSTEYLLATAGTGSEPSLNISFLTNLFKSGRNKDTLLCRSTLFDWARAESWGPLSTTRRKRELDYAVTDLVKDSEENLELVEDNDALNEMQPIPEEDPDAEHMRVMDDGLCGKEADSKISCSRSQSSHRQLSAKLHCLYGVSINTVYKQTISPSRYSLRSDTASIVAYARSLVYDLRQHTDHTFWGPFLDDGLQTVDWEKIEAIMIVLDHNMKLSAENHHICEGMKIVQEKPFVGATPKSFISQTSSMPIEPAIPLEVQDPYNITGTWMRVVCFLDYTELYDFNFGDQDVPINSPRPPIDTDEAIRLIIMKLRVNKIEPPGEDDGQELPVVHFSGQSSSLRPSLDPNANSKTKGTVRLTPQGDVKWTTFTVFHGEERWRSESIQIGGVRSGRGTIGFWFDKDFDEHGPAGPTSFWKLHDGIEEKKLPGPHSPMTRFTMPLY